MHAHAVTADPGILRAMTTVGELLGPGQRKPKIVLNWAAKNELASAIAGRIADTQAPPAHTARSVLRQMTYSRDRKAIAHGHSVKRTNKRTS